MQFGQTHESVLAAYDKNLRIQGSQQHSYDLLFDHLLRKKLQMSNQIQFQKIMFYYLNLAFQLHKYTDVRQALKSYRVYTQNQFTDSLMKVCLKYRDLLEKQFNYTKQNLRFTQEQLEDFQDIEQEESPQQLFAHSFKVQQKGNRDQMRIAMKVLWDGYKNIIQTVRSNYRLDQVYMHTMDKICDFAVQFHRRLQFKKFSDYMRTYFNMLVNKYKKNQIDNAKQPTHIEIERPQHNQKAVQIRYRQFGATLQLSLWQQSFQILEDINQLMKIKKGAPKRSTIEKYFQNMSKLFFQSDYNLYYAFAYYHYYLYFRKEEKKKKDAIQKTADKLILAVLAIFPLDQPIQSEQNRLKINSLISSSNQLPSKSQLLKSVKQVGVLQQTSQAIKKVWIMLQQKFNILQLQSISLVIQRGTKQKQKKLKELLQKNVIYKALIRLQQIYSSMELDRLYSIIPFKKEIINRILLKCNEAKQFNALVDQESNKLTFLNTPNYPFQNLINFCIKCRDVKERITPQELCGYQLLDLLNDSQALYKKRKDQNRSWLNLRHKYKLQREKQTRLIQEKERQEKEARARKEFQEQQRMRQQQLRLKQEYQAKSKIIKEMMSIKGQRQIKYNDKKINSLQRQQLDKISLQEVQDWLKQLKGRIAQQQYNKIKSIYTKADYMYRQRRKKELGILDKMIGEQTNKQSIIKKRSLPQSISVLIENQYKREEDKYQRDLQRFKKQMKFKYQQLILKRVQQLHQLKLHRIKEEKEKALREEEKRKEQTREENSGWNRKNRDEIQKEQEQLIIIRIAKVKIQRGNVQANKIQRGVNQKDPKQKQLKTQQNKAIKRGQGQTKPKQIDWLKKQEQPVQPGKIQRNKAPVQQTGPKINRVKQMTIQQSDKKNTQTNKKISRKAQQSKQQEKQSFAIIRKQKKQKKKN